MSDAVPFDPGEKGLGVIVYENKDAARPLSRALFRGPYDERWFYDGVAAVSVFRGPGFRRSATSKSERGSGLTSVSRKRRRNNDGYPEA